MYYCSDYIPNHHYSLTIYIVYSSVDLPIYKIYATILNPIFQKNNIKTYHEIRK